MLQWIRVGGGGTMILEFNDDQRHHLALAVALLAGNAPGRSPQRCRRTALIHDDLYAWGKVTQSEAETKRFQLALVEIRLFVHTHHHPWRTIALLPVAIFCNAIHANSKHDDMCARDKVAQTHAEKYPRIVTWSRETIDTACARGNGGMQVEHKQRVAVPLNGSVCRWDYRGGKYTSTTNESFRWIYDPILREL
jgi:hypothetical protein